MKYPSCYVLVTDMDEPGNSTAPTSCLLGKASPPINNKLSSGEFQPREDPFPEMPTLFLATFFIKSRSSFCLFISFSYFNLLTFIL